MDGVWSQRARACSDLGQTSLRMHDNLNCSFWPVEGQSLMLACPELAVSAVAGECTSAEPRPEPCTTRAGTIRRPWPQQPAFRYRPIQYRNTNRSSCSVVDRGQPKAAAIDLKKAARQSSGTNHMGLPMDHSLRAKPIPSLPMDHCGFVLKQSALPTHYSCSNFCSAYCLNCSAILAAFSSPCG